MRETTGLTTVAKTSTAEDEMPTLRSEQLYQNDPVFRRLFSSKFRGRLTITINVLLAGIVFFGGAVLNDGLFNQKYDDKIDHSTAVAYDVITSTRKISLMLLALTVYYLLPHWIAKLFNTLKRNSVISHPRQKGCTYDRFLNDMIRKTDRKIWSILGLLTVIVFYIYRIGGYDPQKRPIWLEAAALLVYGLAYYCFLPTLIKLWLALFSTNRLFNSFHIRVNPLHPDNAGGLSPVGRLFSNYVIVFVAFGLIVAIGIVSSFMRGASSVFGRTETWLLLVGYASFPLLIWGWLWTPHKAMREARDRKLSIIAEEFLKATPDEILPTKETTERLSELKQQYELLRESYPTWPIYFRQVNRLVALASTPLITTALPIIIKILTVLIPSRLQQPGP